MPLRRLTDKPIPLIDLKREMVVHILSLKSPPWGKILGHRAGEWAYVSISTQENDIIQVYEQKQIYKKKKHIIYMLLNKSCPVYRFKFCGQILHVIFLHYFTKRKTHYNSLIIISKLATNPRLMRIYKKIKSYKV